MDVLKLVEKGAKKLVPKYMRKFFRASRYELKMQQLSPVDLIIHVGAHWADSVEKHHVAGAESKGLNSARAPFLSGFAHLLRCRKDLG